MQLMISLRLLTKQAILQLIRIKKVSKLQLLGLVPERDVLANHFFAVRENVRLI